MSIATVIPYFLPQFCDQFGKPLASGKLYAFQAGSSTPQNMYTDSGLTTPWANPLTLGADGRPSGPIYLLTTPAYKFRVDDVNGVTQIGPVDSIIAYAPAS